MRAASAAGPQVFLESRSSHQCGTPAGRIARDRQLTGPTLGPERRRREPETGDLLTKIGQLTTARCADRLAELGLRPKHFGLLPAIRSTPPGSQSELGQAMRLVPSAIVTMLDDLEKRGAVVRTADPRSRRRFIVELTAHGTELLEKLVLSHGLLSSENMPPTHHDQAAN